jgi:peptidoglycan/xylan/chitin deacetylase (PgdA/CDA1 family)
MKHLLILLFFTNSLFPHNFTHLIDKQPTVWAEHLPGVKRLLKAQEKVLALTLDLCGSDGDSLDERIVTFLVEKKIPATFFVTGKWIKKHKDHLMRLQKHEWFDFQNHGLLHRPCSVNGQSVYGICGTKNIDEIVEEVQQAAIELEKLTGCKQKFYRSGTAFYDDVALEVVTLLGYQAVGFDILGDAGASYPKEKVVEAMLKSKPGSIIIVHANHPERPAGEGVVLALERLLQEGFRFVKLVDYELSD